MIRLARRRGERLDQPYATRRAQLRPTYEPDAIGRAAERIARFLGTARFIAVQTVVIVLWVLYNIFAPASIRFDNYPFIFLTLALSLQAAYAAPLILLAQNRQDDRDRANLAQDREASVRLQDDSDYLARELAAMRISIGDLASRDFLRSELKALLADLEGRGPGGRGGKARRGGRDRRRDEGVPAALNGVSGPARSAEPSRPRGPAGASQPTDTDRPGGPGSAPGSDAPGRSEGS